MPKFRIGPKAVTVDSLSDEELLREARARRARRGTSVAPETSAPKRALRSLKQAYANLELPEGASLDDAKAAYARLLSRYHPQRHAGDPEKYRAATQLASRLTDAFETLRGKLGA